MTFAKQWLRERERKGEQSGERKSLIKIAKRMIVLDKTDEEIMELTDLTKEDIEDLRK